MKKEEVDPRIIEFLRGTDQYELFVEASEKDRIYIIKASVALIEKYMGNIKEAIRQVTNGRDDLEQILFPKEP